MRRIDSISNQLTEQLMIASDNFVWFSLALDESTDKEDTAQLLIFIRGINKKFVITEELLGLEPMKDTTTGKDLFEHAVHCMEKNNLSWNKMASITADGAKAFTGKNVGMVKLLKKIKSRRCKQWCHVVSLHFASGEPLYSCPRFKTRGRSYRKCGEHNQSKGIPPSTI